MRRCRSRLQWGSYSRNRTDNRSNRNPWRSRRWGRHNRNRLDRARYSSRRRWRRYRRSAYSSVPWIRSKRPHLTDNNRSRRSSRLRPRRSRCRRCTACSKELLWSNRWSADSTHTFPRRQPNTFRRCSSRSKSCRVPRKGCTSRRPLGPHRWSQPRPSHLRRPNRRREFVEDSRPGCR
jgi:hypothetical protein